MVRPRGDRLRNPSINKDFRVNEQILRGPREGRIKDVRVIDEASQPLGIIGVREALSMAQEKGLDLIEVAPNANPPVCRIMDYGKYKYEQEKREREQHKKSKQIEVKDVKIDPRYGAIGVHDLQIKVKNILRFLEDGDKVKVIYRFTGRMITHPEIGRQTFEQVIEMVGDHGQLEKSAVMEGKMMTMIFSPKAVVK